MNQNYTSNGLNNPTYIPNQSTYPPYMNIPGYSNLNSNNSSNNNGTNTQINPQYAENLFFTNSDKSLEVITLKQDVYQRELCQITIDRFDYGRKIVEDGFAVVYKKGKYIDDKKYKQDLLSAQQTAKDGRRGLWKDYFEIMEAMSND